MPWDFLMDGKMSHCGDSNLTLWFLPYCLLCGSSILHLSLSVVVQNLYINFPMSTEISSRRVLMTGV